MTETWLPAPDRIKKGQVSPFPDPFRLSILTAVQRLNDESLGKYKENPKLTFPIYQLIYLLTYEN